mgnify:CR=1 FL=1
MPRGLGGLGAYRRRVTAIADAGLILPIGHVTVTMDLVAIGAGHTTNAVGAVRPVLERFVLVTFQTDAVEHVRGFAKPPRHADNTFAHFLQVHAAGTVADLAVFQCLAMHSHLHSSDRVLMAFIADFDPHEITIRHAGTGIRLLFVSIDFSRLCTAQGGRQAQDNEQNSRRSFHHD